MVRTVLGDIAGSALGHMQCHEHLFILRGPSFESNPALLMEDSEKTTAELFDYRMAGGGGVLDAQPGFCGRMGEALVEASLRTGVHIVSVTGFHKRMFYPADCPLLTMARDEAAACFYAELTEGMLSETGERLHARAGAVKIAYGSDGAAGLDPVLTGAAADAAKQAGVPVIVHTEKDCDVLALLFQLDKAGISPEHVIICHLDRTNRDFNTHLAVLEAGAYLDYDSINRLKYLSHDEELDTLCTMLDHGYEKQLLLSLDTTNARLRHYGGTMGLDYILTVFIPMLQKRGVTQEQIMLMTRENAAQALRLY